MYKKLKIKNNQIQYQTQYFEDYNELKKELVQRKPEPDTFNKIFYNFEFEEYSYKELVRISSLLRVEASLILALVFSSTPDNQELIAYLKEYEDFIKVNDNNIEIEIVDLNINYDLILAIFAWIEARLVDFLVKEDLFVNLEEPEITGLYGDNEYNACCFGLGGHFSDWYYEEETNHYEAIIKRLEDNIDLIKELDLELYLKPIDKIIKEGSVEED